MVRCLICFFRFSKVKKLYGHYFKCHRKIEIIRKFIEENILLPSVLKKHRKKNIQSIQKKRTKKPCQKFTKLNIEDLPTEPVVLSENIRIFCGDDEIIRIGDNKHSIKLSFEDDGNQNKDICCLTLKEIGSQNEANLPGILKRNNKKENTCKKKVKRKKIAKKKKQNIEINITKIKEPSLPSKPTAAFEANCFDPRQYPKNELRLLTSDTESCSDTSKNSSVPLEDTKLFCMKCGSGYKTQHELSEHMYIHEPFCRLCNTWFPDEFTFKQHMQLHKIRIFACHVCSAEFPFKELLFKHFECHMEDRLYEDVIDMEEDYKTFQYSFVNTNYNTSINSILCYLKDRPDFYYCNYKIMKTICDFCYKEVSVNEYERHLQIFHSY
ncbi:uncharacterized protein [Diabrotica undecimpunctata]|uniref:uncharacterized protein n=1 Tax=Diabrotica undecimpunctata TaxID=50387 RepID=UPI003B64033B